MLKEKIDRVINFLATELDFQNYKSQLCYEGLKERYYFPITTVTIVT